VDKKLIPDGEYVLTFVIESRGERIAIITKSAIVKGNKTEIKDNH